MKADKQRKKTKQNGTRQKLPAGWDEARVRRVLNHYENQTDDAGVAEDESVCDAPEQTVIVVPTELVPRIRALIARRRGA